jgi:hypothetical protein
MFRDVVTTQMVVYDFDELFDPIVEITKKL